MSIARTVSLIIFPSALLLFSSSVSTQVTGGTKFRGIGLSQSVEEIQKIMSSHGFKPKWMESVNEIWGQDTSGTICASAAFRDGRAIRLELSPCYFRMDSRTNSKDFGQAIVDNFPIQKLDVGSRVELGVPGLSRTERLTFYYGRLKTGESIEIPIRDYPVLVVTPGEKVGGPVFK